MSRQTGGLKLLPNVKMAEKTWGVPIYHKEVMMMNNCSNNFNYPGAGCSKLTTSLVKVSLKFQTLISEVIQYFLLRECKRLLQCKSFSHFFNKKYQYIWLLSRKHLTS